MSEREISKYGLEMSGLEDDKMVEIVEKFWHEESHADAHKSDANSVNKRIFMPASYRIMYSVIKLKAVLRSYLNRCEKKLSYLQDPTEHSRDRKNELCGPHSLWH